MLGFLERVCESKASYESVRHAVRAKHTVMKRGGALKAKAVMGCDPYRCPFCGEFHLGHSRQLLEAGQ
jgi:hypothetical protein